MKDCKVPIIFAYIAIVYILASILYIIQTRSYGTPFKDAVRKYPDLLKIKNNSIDKRRKAFYRGLMVSIILLIFIRPL
tara:strand:+ start:6931 stop:7164 length:234 start_codon:yes stop_codon:yes gene_type:complete